MSYESINPFNTLWDMNVICYECNGFGHRSFECRKNKPVSYNSFKYSSSNENVKCYNCQEFGRIVKFYKNRKIKQKRIDPNQELVVKSEHKIAAHKNKETKPVWVEKEKDKAESSEIVQTALHAEWKNLWVVDSGCSNHMTSDKKKFIKLEDWNGGSVRFRDNSSIKIKGKGTLNIDEKLKEKDVYYVEGLKHNLLSVSQMCDKGYKFTFDSVVFKI